MKAEDAYINSVKAANPNMFRQGVKLKMTPEQFLYQLRQAHRAGVEAQKATKLSLWERVFGHKANEL